MGISNCAYLNKLGDEITKSEYYALNDIEVIQSVTKGDWPTVQDLSLIDAELNKILVLTDLRIPDNDKIQSKDSHR